MERTVVVTGGTAGIGMKTATGLARLGWRVLVTGRDAEKGRAAVETIRKEAGSGKVELVTGDLTTRAAVQRLASDILKVAPVLHVLINNAGAFPQALVKTEDGLELCFAVNVAAPYLLAHALLPALEAGAPSRVINLTGGRPSNALDVDNLQAEKGFVGLNVYDHSKRAADAMSLVLASELQPRGVLVNVVYPGQASTGMTQSVKAEHMAWWMRAFHPIFAWMTADDGGKSATRASRSSIWAATSAELDGLSGRYFDTDCKPGKLHASVRDAANQQRVMALIPRG